MKSEMAAPTPKKEGVPFFPPPLHVLPYIVWSVNEWHYFIEGWNGAEDSKVSALPRG